MSESGFCGIFWIFFRFTGANFGREKGRNMKISQILCIVAVYACKGDEGTGGKFSPKRNPLIICFNTSIEEKDVGKYSIAIYLP